MIQKFDLNDLTVLIPVRIDSPERAENLEAVLSFIKSRFETNIMVLEADKQEQVFSTLIDRKVFVQDFDRVFYRTRYLNRMTRMAQTPYLAIWDTDVLPEPEQLTESIDLLRENSADMVFPYNGEMFSVPDLIRNLFLQTERLEVISENRDKLPTVYGHFMNGGLFLVNREAYCFSGMENEYFYGWGPEDEERVKRWEILGYRIARTGGPLYHLYHPRLSNSWFGSQAIEANNRRELLRTCSLSPKELSQRVKTQFEKHVTCNETIGLAVIGTGKYYEMALSMIASARLYFFRQHQVQFFLFTDAPIPETEDMTVLFTKHEPWPYPTLKKFHYLWQNRECFEGMDYLFLCDADMFFLDEVGREILPDQYPFLTGTQHPAFCGHAPSTQRRGTYETNPVSTACVSPEEGKIYFAGGFNGGRTREFLEMAKTIRNNINIDLDSEFIALWHDESHINRYYIDHPPKVIPPEYCYPESWGLPFRKRLLALDKNHAQMRS